MGTTLPAQAQWQAGFNMELIRNRVMADYSDQSTIQSQAWPGFGVGLTGLYTLRPYLALQTGLEYTRKSQHVHNTGFHDRLYTRITRNYLEVPFGLRLTYPNGKLKGLLSAGTYGAYWLNGRWRSAFYDLAPSLWDPEFETVSDNYGAYLPLTKTNERYSFDPSFTGDGRKDQRWEWGWYVGTGLVVETKWGNLWSEVRMVRAFSDLNRWENNPPMGYASRKNVSFRLVVGCALPLRSNK